MSSSYDRHISPSEKTNKETDRRPSCLSAASEIAADHEDHYIKNNQRDGRQNDLQADMHNNTSFKSIYNHPTISSTEHL